MRGIGGFQCAALAALSLALACGDKATATEQDGGRDEGVDPSAGDGGPGTTTGTPGATTGGTPTSGASNASADEGSEGGNGEGPSPIDFDLGSIPDAPPPGSSGCGAGGGGGGEPGRPLFSYIWIANSVEGTVSKIDTTTGTEVGRYVTGPTTTGLGDVNNGPSRTSVNLYGDAAVANRNGGVTKIAAQEQDCVDLNGNGGIDTSSGPADVLDWGEDECVLWHHPTPTNPTSYQEGPRPLAWVGELDTYDCPVQNPPLWVGYYNQVGNEGIFERIDGETGDLMDTVEVPWSGQTWGPYGGAVNADGDFFAVGWSAAFVVRIDAETLETTVYNPPGFVSFYGMALDAEGDVWVTGCGDSTVYHLDPDTSTWTTVGTGPGCLRGVQVDTEGRAFIAHNGFPDGLMVVDTATQSILSPNVPLAGAQTPVGVSIDVDGFVWVVDQGGFAFKVDPDTYAIDLQVTGLNSPYTYSDMTGAGLNLVSFPPPTG